MTKMAKLQKQPDTTPFGAASTQVADIEAMDRDQLCNLWPKLMRQTVPRGMSQTLMRRFLAFEIQAGIHGGLNKADLAKIMNRASPTQRSNSPQMAIGSRFLREWNGTTHIVERIEEGYQWNGQTYASLSAIAKLITGAYWSGPRFFGLAAATANPDAPVKARKGSQAKVRAR